VSRKGDLKAVLKMNIGLDEDLAKAVTASAEQNERRWTQEVRFRLREAYGLDRTPAEDTADVSA
jgi:hypothetical protein